MLNVLNIAHRTSESDSKLHSAGWIEFAYLQQELGMMPQATKSLAKAELAPGNDVVQVDLASLKLRLGTQIELTDISAGNVRELKLTDFGTAGLPHQLSGTVVGAD